MVSFIKTKYGLKKMLNLGLGNRISHLIFFGKRMGEKDLILVEICCSEVAVECYVCKSKKRRKAKEYFWKLYVNAEVIRYNITWLNKCKGK